MAAFYTFVNIESECLLRFSGIEGYGDGLKRWIRLRVYCEISPSSQAVLRARIADGHLAPGSIVEDVRDVSGAQLAELGVKIIIGGFPCQDISVAGNQRGFTGERCHSS
jgi:DNA (cytosine-5)-methyltransferase 1